jgi:secreted trypsin-like serine protease
VILIQLKRMFCLLLLTVSIAYAAGDKQDKIVGGIEATENAWPWVVSLGDKPMSATENFCGGSLIAERWVLTAAHCFVNGAGDLDDVTPYFAYVGGFNLNTSPGLLVAAKRLIKHPSYDPLTLENDLLLIELKTPVIGVPFLPLLSDAVMNTINPGDDMTVIGWGSTVGYDPSNPSPTANYPTTLRQVSLPLVDNLTCNNALTNEGFSGDITSNMLCAGLANGGKDSCQGDSGGPLMIQLLGQWYQTGLVSWGYGCAAANFYGVYTRVSNYTNWIAGYTNVLSVSDLNLLPVVVGKSIKQTLYIINKTANPVTITSKSFSNGSNLSITQDQCPTMVASNSRCGITITYTPTVSGELIDSLLIADYPNMEVQITGLAFDEVVFNSTVGDPDPVLIWGTGGDSDWLPTAFTASEGPASLKSGVISDDEASWLAAHVSLSAEKVLYFDWKVSSEENYDGLAFFLDGKRLNTLHGNVDWVQNRVIISAGEHVLHWRYSKDYYDPVTEGSSDQAWLDNVSFREIVITDTNTSTAGGSSSSGTIGLYSLFVLFLYAYMTRYRRFL